MPMAISWDAPKKRMTQISVGNPATGSPHKVTLTSVHNKYNKAPTPITNPKYVAQRRGDTVKLVKPSIANPANWKKFQWEEPY